MRKLFISAGHTNVKGKDQGASGNGYIEGVETVRLRDAIVNHYKKLGGDVTIDSNSNTLAHTLTYFKNLVSPTSIVLDIHFNAASPSATGTETLIPNNNTEFERNLAYDLSYKVSKTLGIPARGKYNGLTGVKTEKDSHHGSLGWMKLTGDNVLMEICFISNKNDMESYEENFEKLAKEIAEVLYLYSLLEDVQDPTVHIVQIGDTLSKIASKYKTSVANLQELNKLNSPNKIYVGQKLKLK